MSVASRRGYDFEREWERSLYKEGWLWVCKLPDARAMKGFNMPYAPKVPFDFMAASHNMIHFYECKQTKAQSIDIERLKEHQLNNLTMLESLGFMADFVFNFNNRKRKKDERDNRVWMVKASVVVVLIEIAKANGRKSIPKKEIMENGAEYVWEKLSKNDTIGNEEYEWYWVKK